MYQAFNARPEGAKSSQPRASERSERHPGLGRRVSDTPPEGAKAATGGIFRHNFPPPSPHFPPPSPHFPPPSPAFNAAVPRISTAIPRISTPVIAFAPFGGVSLSPLPNPGCRFASLACPGLGAYYPFGVLVERLTHAWTSFGAPPPRNPPSGNPTPPSGNPLPPFGNPLPPFGKPLPPSGKPAPSRPRPRPAARRGTSKLIHPYTAKKTLFA